VRCRRCSATGEGWTNLCLSQLPAGCEGDVVPLSALFFFAPCRLPSAYRAVTSQNAYSYQVIDGAKFLILLIFKVSAGRSAQVTAQAPRGAPMGISIDFRARTPKCPSPTSHTQHPEGCPLRRFLAARSARSRLSPRPPRALRRESLPLICLLPCRRQVLGHLLCLQYDASFRLPAKPVQCVVAASTRGAGEWIDQVNAEGLKIIDIASDHCQPANDRGSGNQRVFKMVTRPARISCAQRRNTGASHRENVVAFRHIVQPGLDLFGLLGVLLAGNLYSCLYFADRHGGHVQRLTRRGLNPGHHALVGLALAQLRNDVGKRREAYMF
jgi:hypothetical protein